MHRSVMQNKKYMKWSSKSSVEVVTVSGIEAGVAKGGKKGGTYTAKDGKEYLLQWPNLTKDELSAISKSEAASKFKVDGGYPTTHVVDPHTLESVFMKGGGLAPGKIMDVAGDLQRKLKKEHGKGITRKKLSSFNKDMAKARAVAATDLGAALSDTGKIEKGAAKLPQPLQDKVAALKKELIEAASKELDDIEGLIARGDKKAGQKALRKLMRGLRGSDLEARANELMKKTKAE